MTITKEGLVEVRKLLPPLAILFVFGCATNRGRVAAIRHDDSDSPTLTSFESTAQTNHLVTSSISKEELAIEDATTVGSDWLTQVVHKVPAAEEQPTESEGDESGTAKRLIPPRVDQLGQESLGLDSVIASVYESYPSLDAAIHQRGIALGQQITAQGAFDTKLKAASDNTPVGFYETYRNSIGVIQPLYSGGEVFAGYRIGRGSFEPWYQERQTNGGGEFKTGLVVPIAQDRSIDQRRADLWRAEYERNVVEAEIQAQLIDFIQQASVAYWNWVAAGESARVAEEILQLADSRTDRIRKQVNSGLIDPPELTDNLRLIAERKSKIAQTSRKLQKSAIKLSLYHRGLDGQPIIPERSQLPRFPEPVLVDVARIDPDSQIALQQRPELAMFDLVKRQLDVDYAQACNQLRPELDAVITASKDTGEPTSSKNDKGPFQLDASIFLDVPLQRRKARGKIQSIESKVSQLNAKRRLTEDMIVADVQTAYASLTTDYEQVQQARQAVKFAEELAQRERLNFELGSSDLLKVTLREQYAVESRQKEIDALLDYFISQANYRAALAEDRLNR